MLDPHHWVEFIVKLIMGTAPATSSIILLAFIYHRHIDWVSSQPCACRQIEPNVCCRGSSSLRALGNRPRAEIRDVGCKIRCSGAEEASKSRTGPEIITVVINIMITLYIIIISLIILYIGMHISTIIINNNSTLFIIINDMLLHI